MIGWLLVAAAVVLAPGPSRPGIPRPGTPHPGGLADRAAGPPRTLVACALVATIAGAVALSGPPAGAVVALVGCPSGWWGLRRMRPGHATPAEDRWVALVLDLAAAALRAGRPPADAVSAAAQAAGPEIRAAFERVAGLLRLGAEPAQAWAVLARDGPLGPVSTVAVRSAASGARLAAAFERLAVELRAEATADATARAQRAGVRAMAPLAACFLPSFVLLGVVPVVVGVARAALTDLP
ncbi:Flp pilus assembly protein TadB [Jatrophihabitans endophyticus]|uniref:Flp pilus assembly protein TadB n=1 Tax=Jatrophihabitans endophyticus TaxID=1206085 RepID=A0A1M5H1X2_9ACTN|nr:type II secretion system F family protein [Jatrophihabitans endophyticus]SHG09918.1 Flp pilus assembly protein TadB [Jatrophihabitans endophyticus]